MGLLHYYNISGIVSHVCMCMIWAQFVVHNFEIANVFCSVDVTCIKPNTTFWYTGFIRRLQ